jgi:biopolymer transport protein TolR
VSASRPSSSIAEPNVTPMIDVLLVLLIVFMVASVSRKHLEAQLPREQETRADGPSIVLTVGPGPRYSLNQQAVHADSLAAVLARVYAGRPDKTLIVRGEPGAKYREVFRAMDVSRGAGVLVLGADTRR